MSFAENLGTGTLGDGFTGLGGSFFGDWTYSVQLTGAGDPRVPEPAPVALLLAGAAMLAAFSRRRPRGCGLAGRH